MPGSGVLVSLLAVLALSVVAVVLLAKLRRARDDAEQAEEVARRRLLALTGADGLAWPAHVAPNEVLEAAMRAAGEDGHGVAREAEQTRPLPSSLARDLVVVVTELLDNALGYCDAEDVAISARSARDGGVLVEVDDGGGGMDKDELREANRTVKSATPPTLEDGFGLYLAGRLAARHGMKVVLSQREEGIRATVHVPLSALAGRPQDAAREEEAAAEETRRASQAGGSSRDAARAAAEAVARIQDPDAAPARGSDGGAARGRPQPHTVARGGNPAQQAASQGSPTPHHGQPQQPPGTPPPSPPTAPMPQMPAAQQAAHQQQAAQQPGTPPGGYDPQQQYVGQGQYGPQGQQYAPTAQAYGQDPYGQPQGQPAQHQQQAPGYAPHGYAQQGQHHGYAQPQYGQRPPAGPPGGPHPQAPQHQAQAPRPGAASPEQTAADVTASWTSPWESQGRRLEETPDPHTTPPAPPTAPTPAYGSSYGAPGGGYGQEPPGYGQGPYGQGGAPSGAAPEYSPIFDQVASSWFDAPPQAEEEPEAWSSPADEGWSAAERLLDEPSAPSSGELPRREPMSRLVPGSARPGASRPFRMTRPEGATADAWAAYQDRVDEGRRSWPDGRGRPRDAP